MMAGLEAYNGLFLSSLSDLESRIAKVNSEISSGIRVQEASDDPAAVAPIISYQSQISAISQVQTNLSTTQVEAQTADGALQNAASLLDQLTSLGSRGASSTVSATDRQTFATQVQDIEQQLVTIANTAVNGRYIFGGDNATTPPVTYDPSTPGIAPVTVAATNTATVSNSSGNELVPRLTAQQIFDVQNPPGTPATGNIFQAAFSLSQALLNNNQAGINAALDQVKAGVAQLGQATTSYGDIENWISQALSTSTSQLTNVKAALGAVRDSDIAADATQLTLDQTALQASLTAHGSLNTKSLFSYLG